VEAMKSIRLKGSRNLGVLTTKYEAVDRNVILLKLYKAMARDRINGPGV